MIENEGLGISIWKLSSDEVCFIEDLDEDTKPMQFVLNVAAMEADNITVHSSLLKTLYVYNIDVGFWRVRTDRPGDEI